jgi:hypothetical protein
MLRGEQPVARKRAPKSKRAALRRGATEAKRAGGPRNKRVRRKGNLAISFEPTLASQVRDAADKQSDGNVSAWLAEAARERLRLDAGWAYVRDFEARNGAISDDELKEIDRLWPQR